MASYALASKLVGPGKQEGEADGLRETDESSEERESARESATRKRGLVDASLALCYIRVLLL